MSEHARSALISASEHSPILKPKWVEIPLYSASNSVPSMCAGFYLRAAAWSGVDEQIFKAATENVAQYIVKTRGDFDLPESYLLLSVTHWENGKYVVNEDWNQDEAVRCYLKQKGIDVD